MGWKIKIEGQPWRRYTRSEARLDLRLTLLGRLPRKTREDFIRLATTGHWWEIADVQNTTNACSRA